ncbi:MAG: hypothetical protein EA356_14775 [Geminicoccaceae bacterium]|nr:MAG: hypothetical protein EA356_14775 [Geminicoccaceae bacterium]
MPIGSSVSLSRVSNSSIIRASIGSGKRRVTTTSGRVRVISRSLPNPCVPLPRRHSRAEAKGQAEWTPRDGCICGRFGPSKAGRTPRGAVLGDGAAVTSTRNWWWPVLIVGCLVAALPALAGEVGRVTGLPVPRFVSIGVEVANLRVGPRNSYDVIAIYRRRGMPLKVLDEFDTWREVEDHEGTRGWMHQRLLSGRRTVMVIGEAQTLRRAPAEDAVAMLVAEPLVLGELLRCQAAWCFVEIDRRRGWMQASGLWGITP